MNDTHILLVPNGVASDCKHHWVDARGANSRVWVTTCTRCQAIDWPALNTQINALLLGRQAPIREAGASR